MLEKINKIIQEGTKVNNIETSEAKEIKLNETKEVVENKQILEPDIEVVKNSSLESVIESNKEKLEQLNQKIKEYNQASEFRPLDEIEKMKIQERTGMTNANIEKCTINNEGIVRLKCINEEYAGKIHIETGVPYVEKFVDINGIKIKVVVPEFSSIIDYMLPDELKMASESKQFVYLNNKLREEISINPEVREQFTERQIKMIEKGMKPEGFTWHHKEECCKMQLVRFESHSKTRHTGGNSIWSCGT